MAASTGLHAFGGDVKYSATDSTYATIGEIADSEPPAWMTMAAKATHLQSPNNATEKAIGPDSSDPAKVTMNFTQTEYAAIVALKRTKGYWKFFAPLATGQTTPASWKFYGFITKIGAPKMDPEDNNIMVVLMEWERASGLVTFAAGS